jgi:transposase InsO family protein
MLASLVSVALALVGASRTLDESYYCNMVPPMWEMAGADGLQLDLDDDDSCDRFHNTTTYDSSVLAFFSDVNVDNDPHSTPATLPLIKSGTKYGRPLHLMIDDETTAFCETLHSPVDAPNAYRECYFEWVFNGSSPISQFDRGTCARLAPAVWPHPHTAVDANGDLPVPYDADTVPDTVSQPQPWPAAESVSVAAISLLFVFALIEFLPSIAVMSMLAVIRWVHVLWPYAWRMAVEAWRESAFYTFYLCVRPTCYAGVYLFIFAIVSVVGPVASLAWAAVWAGGWALRFLLGSTLAESVLMMDGDAEADGSWDARKYPRCRPFDGKKGQAFETFVRDFGSSLASECDDDSDLEETMLGTDVGGDVYLAGGGAAPNGPQTRRRNKRNKIVYSQLYRHITDIRLREMLHAQTRNDGRAAFLLLVVHCRRAITDLELADLDEQWNAATIASCVGVTADSITHFTRYINGLNARRPVGDRKGADELTKKLLLAIVPDLSPSMASDAFKELRAPAAGRRYHDAAAGTRDYDAAVRDLDEMWRSLFHAGAIKPSALKKGVRAENAAIGADSDVDADSCCLVGTGPRRVFTAAETRAQRICRNCFGFDHLMAVCPSASGIRPLSICVEMLRSSGRGAPDSARGGDSGGRGKGKGKGGRGGRFGGRSGVFRVSSLVVDADGNVFDSEGAFIGSTEASADADDAHDQSDAVGHDPAGDDADEANFVLDDGDEWMRFAVDSDADASSESTCAPCDSDASDADDSGWDIHSAHWKRISADDDVEDDLDDGFAVEDTSPSSSVPVFDKPSSGTTSVSSPSSVATRFYSRKAVFAALIGLLSFFAQPVGDLLLTRSHTAQSVGIGVIQLESALPADFLIAGGGSSLFDKRASAKDLIVDCGATKHCVPTVQELDTVTDSSPITTVRVGNNSHLSVTAIGTMSVKVKTQWVTRRKNKTTIVAGSETMRLSNVLVVPKMPCRLFSCRWGYDVDGIATYLNDSNCLQLPSGSRVPFKPSGKHYLIDTVAAASEADGDDADLYHARLCHFSAARLNESLRHRDGSGGKLHSRINHDPTTCEACMMNMRRKPVPKVSTVKKTYTHFGQRVSSDTCGPFPESPSGFRYAVCFYDSYSKYVAVYFLKQCNSAEVQLAHQTYLSDHKSYLLDTLQPGVVDEWYTDNGTEFVSGSLDDFCAELGTRRAYSVPYEPTRNAGAERVWGILLRPARAMAAHCGNDTVTLSLWPFALSQACQVHNSLKTLGHSPPRAPLEVLLGSDPPLDHFRVMFCDAYCVLRDAEIPTKVSSTRVKCTHLGWDPRRKGYFVYVGSIGRVTTVLNVNFNERAFTALVHLPAPSGVTLKPRDLPVPVHRSSLPDPPAPPPLPTQAAVPAPPPPVPHVRLRFAGQDSAAVAGGSAGIFDTILAALHDGDVPFSSSSVGESVLLAPDDVGPIPIPKSVQQALSDPIYGQKWREACLEEIRGKYEINRAWEIVTTVPSGNRVMKGKWIFKVEYNLDGTVKRFKARWVGCGYSQVQGVNFGETYASTLGIAPTRAFFAACAVADLDIEEGDVIKAFSTADMDEYNVYVEQPHGFADPTGVACKLLRPLEGTKQAAHLFSTSNAKWLVDVMKFSRSSTEPNIYWKTVDGSTIRACVYVDNVLTAFEKNAAGRKLNEDFWTQYGERFNTERRGPPKRFLGMEIARKDRRITLTQEKYITDAGAKFLNGVTSKTCSTPVHYSQLEAFTKITTASNDVERAAMQSKAYLSLCGTLLWATISHPEIAYYVSFICQFMHDPSLAAWDAGITILTYLQSVKSIGITYDGENPTFVVFTDSSFGQAPVPFGGHVVMFAGGAVSFQARKLKLVPQSSMEAETACYSVGSKDLVYMSNVIGSDGMQLDMTKPITTYCDNDAAVSNVKNVGTSMRNRHFEKWLHFGRELFLKLTSKPIWIETKLNVADIFTKPLDKTSFLKFRSILLNIRHDLTSPEILGLVGY